MTDDKTGLVLLSGGLDSSTCLAIALDECSHVEAISLSYGQKHVKENESAVAVARHFNVRLEILDLPRIFEGAGSTLVDSDRPNPRLSYAELAEAEGPSPTYVPQRNMNFLGTAAAIALVRKLDYIYFGAHADDAHNWAYPDCTPEFIGSMSSAIYIGSYMKTRLRAPFMSASKADVVEQGAKLGVPFHMTWSCYEGGDKHCGLCPTCMSRIVAFEDAGIDDPTEYEATPEPRQDRDPVGASR